MKKTSLMPLIFRGLFGVFAALLAVSIGAWAILDTHRVSIDFQLGTVSSEVVIPETDEDLYNFKSDFDSTAELVAYHKDLGERVEEEGIVLLRNEGDALPLSADEDRNVTLLGMRFNYPQYGGQLSSSPKASQNVDPFTAFAERGLSVNPTMKGVYDKLKTLSTLGRTGGFNAPLTDFQPGQFSNSFGVGNTAAGLEIAECDPARYAELSGVSSEQIAESNREYSTAIVMIGRPTTEAADFFPGETGMKNPDEFEEGKDILGLSKNEKALLTYAEENFEKVIVLINSGNAMDVPELKEDPNIDAVAWIGEPSNYGFYGVADVLVGSVSPSGHLPDTFATKASLSPAMQNFGIHTFADQDPDFAENRNGWYLAEAEGIYIGYYYYETRFYDSVARKQTNASVGSAESSINGQTWTYDEEVVWPFGYGLSYTQFSQEIKSFSCDFENRTLEMEVEVTNIGDFAAKHVVQLYAQSPYIEGGLEKSAIQLIGYEKTQTLQPDASETVTISVDLQYLASYDDGYEHDGVTGAYVFDEGDYYFGIGNGAHEALCNIMAAQGYLSQGNADLSEKQTLAETTYMTRTKNGTLIQNQMQDCDLSNLGVDITYLSRSDWADTFPITYEGIRITDEMTGFENILYEVKTEETVDVKWGVDSGMMFTDLKPAAGETLSYDSEELTRLIDQIELEEALVNIRVGQAGWGIMESIHQPVAYAGGGPMGFSEQTLGARADRTGRYAISEDDENFGYYLNTLPTSVTIAATFSHEIAYEAGAMLGNDSIWNNVVSTWSPGLNQHRTPYNGRNHEYFSEDPMLNAYMGNDWCRGGKDYGLILCPKHFAFNDQETNRSGVAAFFTEQRAREGELRGFQMCFEEQNALGTMTTFNRVGSTYGSAHVGMMTGILRNEWGFKGIAITDMVNGDAYMNVTSAVMAGTDTMDTGSDDKLGSEGWSNFTVAGMSGDNTLQKAVKEAVRHVEWALLNSNFMNGMSDETHIVRRYPWYEQIAIALIVSTAVLSGLSAAGYAISVVREGRKKEA